MLPDEGQELDVGLVVSMAGRVRLHDEQPESAPIGGQGDTEPMAALEGDPELFDLPLPNELVEQPHVHQQRAALSQGVAGDPSSLAASDRLPGQWIGDVVVGRVGVVRVVDQLAIAVVEGEVQVLPVHELADDPVDGRIERRQVARGQRGIGDPVQGSI